MSHLKYRLKLLFIISIAVAWFLTVIYLLRFDILTGMGTFLIVEDPIETADIIFVLTGEVSNRPLHAADLYIDNYAPKIAISQTELSPAVVMGIYPGNTEAAIKVMAGQGVEDSNIVVIDFPGGVTSTRDEARALYDYSQQHVIKKVIVVTNFFHSRRAFYIFRKQFKKTGVKIIFSNAPHWKFDKTNWWQHEAGFITYVNEYLKLVHNVLF